jgi:hypothetical protein
MVAMRTRRFALAVAALIGVVGVGASVASIASAAPESRAVAAPPRDGTAGKVASMAILTERNAQTSTAELARLRALGVNTVTMPVWWQVDSPSATAVHAGRRAIPDARLTALIDAARRIGLRVDLYPLFECDGCAWGWRGLVRPRDTNRFFASYGDFVAHYAVIARDHGVSLLAIGTEMKSLEGEAPAWRALARRVRGIYRGPLTYDVNWDSVARVHFWDAVDLISVSAYFPLSTAPQPSVTELAAAWHHSEVDGFAGRDWFAQLASLARATGKPILFGEAGYQSQAGGTKYPFAWPSRGGRPDALVQATAYQALLQTFEGQPWWQGVDWWQWQPVADAATDPGYSPRGKATEDLLRAWYRDRWRPRTTAPGAADAPWLATARRLQAQAAAAGAPALAPPAPTHHRRLVLAAAALALSLLFLDTVSFGHLLVRRVEAPVRLRAGPLLAGGE